MRLFYEENITPQLSQYEMSQEEAKHIIRVLRMKIGDEFEIIDGKGSKYHAEITSIEGKKCIVSILNCHTEPFQDEEIHIAIAPTKQIDRTEWFIEKATEIGVTKITFISTQQSERTKINSERIIKKAISAIKQSKRLFLPEIEGLVAYSDFVKSNPNGLIAHCEEGSKTIINDVFKKTNCPILIGPEGDFSKEEIELAFQHNYKSINLGKNRLRTETAGLYAVMNAKLILDN